MSMPSGTELLLIFGIVILLFGAKKIPDLAKGIGQGIRNFKKEMKEEEPAAPTASATPEAPKQVETSTTASVEAPKDQTKQA
ncbi:twin-arginine translocase TatA/TatE family subunit [Sulfuricurvum sp. IAE1]|uniref:twin-arginine translocase TatA/TatE family subunit n=1 Tax=Sulfuricurvum sp. IAE1 TaxID=2546102 RepID=UPI0010460830|nr:twin-arginine translocase TatA/TatE family subunit [Sulfuricurvum sp. IAE1]MDD3769600.1 twin-arginine translocase TatA/TatE family subunit [Sulfuricurvum sp.]MDX9965845.1 twin-arginine translocase TatA/TatE family subunit [Sulfuricurvum sp.]TDA62728.1 twin-arginine translocase TatA/TatE family subunit [Sulfuricurvum sp. IAE1]